MSHTALTPSFSCNLGRLVPLNFSGLEPKQAGQIDPTTLQHSPPANLLLLCNIFTFLATSFNFSFFQIYLNSFHIFKVRVTPCCLLPSLSLPTLFWAPHVSVAACLALEPSLPLQVHECISCAKTSFLQERGCQMSQSSIILSTEFLLLPPQM